MTAAAQHVCSELTPLLRSYAREAGLEATLANSLNLVWTGDTFEAHSPVSLDTAEYGNGKGPAPRPVHKAMTRLETDAEKLLTQLVNDVVARQAQAVRY
jgi:hypothetical protein